MNNELKWRQEIYKRYQEEESGISFFLGVRNALVVTIVLALVTFIIFSTLSGCAGPRRQVVQYSESYWVQDMCNRYFFERGPKPEVRPIEDIYLRWANFSLERKPFILKSK